MELGHVIKAARGGERNKQSQKCKEEMVNSGARVMLGDVGWRWCTKNANNLNITKIHTPIPFALTEQ